MSYEMTEKLISSLDDKTPKRKINVCLAKTVDMVLESQKYLWISSMHAMILHLLSTVGKSPKHFSG